MRNFSRALIKLAEECNELAIAALKVETFGPDSRWPDSSAPSNIESMVAEIGDVLTLIDVVCTEIGLEIPQEEIQIAKDKKYIKLNKYLPNIS